MIQESVSQVVRNSITLAEYFVLYLSGVVLQSERLEQVSTIKIARWDLVKGDRDRLLEVIA